MVKTSQLEKLFWPSRPQYWQVKWSRRKTFMASWRVIPEVDPNKRFLSRWWIGMVPPFSADTHCGSYCAPNIISNRGAMQWPGLLKPQPSEHAPFAVRRARSEHRKWVGKSKKLKMPISRYDRHKFRSALRTQMRHRREMQVAER